MFSQYTWGQFFFFVVVLVVLYYIVVGLLYYRDELSALLRGKKAAHGPALGAASSPPALVRTASAFADVPTHEAPAAVDTAAGASANLPTPVAPLVSGTLPDTTAAKGSDAGKSETAPMDAEVASAAELEQQLDEARPDEKLDQADKELAAMLRQAAITSPVAGEVESPVGGVQDDLATDKAFESPESLSLIENNNYTGSNIETNSALESVEAEIVYQPAVADDSELFAGFDEHLASPLDILPVVQEPLLSADSLADFLVQVQRGDKPVVPAELRGTSLVEQVSNLTEQSSQELLALFGQEM